jgi:transcriptional regulator with XRE-family HTH domain
MPLLVNNTRRRMAENKLNTEALVGALDAERKARAISWRKLAQEAGVSPSTLTRIQQGKSPDVHTFAALTQWLQMDTEAFTHGVSPEVTEVNNPMAVVSTLLRGQKKLNPKALSALQELVNAAAAVKLSRELK